MPWHLIGGGHSTYECRFKVKVGHVLEFSPGRWHAFFDGNYVGRADTPEKAMVIVETKAIVKESHARNVAYPPEGGS
jgi:hypothetical protein